MITIIDPGIFTTIQDHGRWGFQAYGVSVAGAMDRYAYRVANLLVGNQSSAAALEMTMRGGVFRIDRDCMIAITGADMQATLNGAPLANWSSHYIAAGSELSFSYAANGCRAYLALYGGIDVPVVLGSRATYTRAKMGGLEGRALKTGDHIASVSDTKTAPPDRTLPPVYVPDYSKEVCLRVLLGPQDDLFEPAGIETLFSQTYTISNDADRMGYRLEGPPIRHKDKADIVSDALCQGAIQVPGHGQPIIMMADRQTTGGYTKIGAVIGPDLSLLAQAKPGDSVRFMSCSEEAAVSALQAEAQTVARLETELAGQTAAATMRCYQVVIDGKKYHVEIEEMNS